MSQKTINFCNTTGHLYEDITFNKPLRTIAQEGQDFILMLSEDPDIAAANINMNTVENNCISNVGSLKAIFPRGSGGLKNLNITMASGNKFSSISMNSGILNVTTSPGDVAIDRISATQFTLQGAPLENEGVYKSHTTIGELLSNKVSVIDTSGVLREHKSSSSKSTIVIDNSILEDGTLNCSGITIENKSNLIGTELIASTTGIASQLEPPVTETVLKEDGSKVTSFPNGQVSSTQVPFISVSDSEIKQTDITTGDFSIRGAGLTASFNNALKFSQEAAIDNYGLVGGAFEGDLSHTKTTFEYEVDADSDTVQLRERLTGSTLRLQGIYKMSAAVTNVLNFSFAGGASLDHRIVQYSGGCIFQADIKIPDPIPPTGSEAPDNRYRGAFIGGGGFDWITGNNIREVPDPVFITSTIEAPVVILDNFINYGTIVASDRILVGNGVNYGTIKSPSFSNNWEIPDSAEPEEKLFINSGSLQTLDGNDHAFTNPEGR